MNEGGRGNLQKLAQLQHIGDHEVPAPSRRFLTLEEAALELGTTRWRVYELVRSGRLPAIKIGGRGQWRIQRSDLAIAAVRARCMNEPTVAPGAHAEGG